MVSMSVAPRCEHRTRGRDALRAGLTVDSEELMCLYPLTIRGVMNSNSSLFVFVMNRLRNR